MCACTVQNIAYRFCGHGECKSPHPLDAPKGRLRHQDAVTREPKAPPAPPMPSPLVLAADHAIGLLDAGSRPQVTNLAQEIERHRASLIAVQATILNTGSREHAGYYGALATLCEDARRCVEHVASTEHTHTAGQHAAVMRRARALLEQAHGAVHRAPVGK